MEESKRKILLSKLERESLTVGVQLPETVQVQGREVPLAEIAFDICSDGQTPSKFDMSTKDIRVELRRERNRLKQEIEDGEISYEEGEENVEKIMVIDRALSVIQRPGENVDIEQEIKKNKAKKTKKWKNFLDKIKLDS